MALTIKKVNMLKSIFILATLFGISNKSIAQSIDLPKISPLSPTSSGFVRYGETPVDHSTGIPSIEIPLYTVKSGELTLPLSISYHSGGNKVMDVSSPIGLGWVLNSGGIVTWTQLDKDDGDVKAFYKTSDAVEIARGAAYQQGTSARVNFCGELDMDYDSKDKQSDRYYYQMPDGKSGIFRYDFITSDLIKLPYSPIKIEKGEDIKLTSENGTIYTYKNKLAGIFPESYLTSITSSDYTDTIRIVYKKGVTNLSTLYYHSQQVDWGDWHSLNYQGEFPRLVTSPQTNYSWNTERVNSYSPLLDSIVSANAIVRFFYTGDRADSGPYRLSSLKVYDRLTGLFVKEVSFQQAYFGSALNNNRRLKLSGLNVKDNNGNNGEQYSFVYDETVELPPYYSWDYSLFHNMEDYWGYFNGSYSDGGIPAMFLPMNVDNKYKGNREPRPDLAKAGLIKEIHYPTKGKTTFEFEPNVNLAGFRIKKITNYSGDNTEALIKTYEYGNSVTPSIYFYDFVYNQRYYFAYDYYLDVSEIEEVRSVAVSTPVFSLTVGNNSPVVYTDVTEYLGTESNNIGKTVFTYSTPIHEHPGDDPRISHISAIDNGLYTPQLLSKDVYKYENGVYKTVSGLSNSYTTYRNNLFSTGIRVARTSTYITNISGSGLTMGDLDYHYSDYFIYNDTKANEKISLLTQSTNYIMDENKMIVDTTQYFYTNQDHLQPTKKIIKKSDQSSVIQTYKYPSDFAGLAPYDALVSRNVINPVIEENRYKNNFSELLESTRTKYNFWGNKIAPSIIERKSKGQIDYEPRLAYHSYDVKGNPSCVSQIGGPKTSYLWGYNKQFVIAEVRNADSNEFYYQGFEETEGVSGNSHSGKKFYNGSYTVNWVIPNSRSYRISYFFYTSSGWKYKEEDYNSSSKLLSGGTAYDDIRICPIDAMMRTYTYDSSVGMTSDTDAKGMTTYYEYDSFQRLKSVKDQNGNIIKSNDYHYKL